MLTALKLVLERYPLVGDLEQDLRIISSFMGPSRLLSLSQACRFGSIELLDWVWASSCTVSTDKHCSWSLHNFLRSDPQYYRSEFALSLRVAAGTGKLQVVEWLFHHFRGCEAPSTVVTTAAKNGHLTVLQFLLPFRAEGRAAEKMDEEVDGVRDFRRGSLQDSELDNVVYWGNEFMLKAAENGHTGVVRWLYENEINEVDEEQRVRLMEHALRVGDFELADMLLPSDGSKCVLDYDRMAPGPELIEWMLDLGYLRDEHVAASAMRDLAKTGHLELMQQILLLHSPSPKDDTEWLKDWGEALENACKSGSLVVVQWLMEHPTGRKRCEHINNTRVIDNLLSVAAEQGHIRVAQYLNEQGATDTRGYALIRAARGGHTDVVQWLLECYSDTIPKTAVTEAIARGHTKILALLHSFTPPAVAGKLRCKRKQSPQKQCWDLVREAVTKYAVTCGHLDVLKWVHSRSMLTSSPDAMDKAAAAGHLDVVKWLHATGSAKFSVEAMDRAAAAGHLNVIQWLHANRVEGCTASAMDNAADAGHLDVIKWLHRNRSEGCTNNAIRNAVNNGHLRVAYWLHTHFSEHTPAHVDVLLVSFDMLLFLHAHYPHLITSRYSTRSPLSSKATPLNQIATWLAANYPLR